MIGKIRVQSFRDYLTSAKKTEAAERKRAQGNGMC